MQLPTITGINLFPSDTLPKSEKKKKEIGSEYGMAIYSKLMQGATLYTVADWKSFDRLRLYADGRQPVDALMDWYTGAVKNNSPEQRISAQGVDEFNPVAMGTGDIVRGQRVFSPMDYQVVSPMPKIVDTITSLVIDESTYKVQCQALNPAHVQKKNMMAWTKYYRNTFAKPQAQKLGVTLAPDTFEPKTEQEVQLALKNNYFRLLFESGFEDIIKHVFNQSNFEQLAITWLRDGVSIPFMCGKRYFCYDSNMTKIKYIDPAKFVIQWNNDTNGKGASYAGHLEYVPMHVVKKRMAALGYSHDKIVEVARQAYQYPVNQTRTWPTNMWEERDATGRWLWLDLSIPILEFEIITQDETRFYKDKEGKMQEIPEDKPKHKYDSKDIKTTVYEGIMVVGSNYMIKWEEAPNNNGKLSYFWARSYGKSMVDRCTSICDDIMKCIVKLRGELWAAAPSGYFFDLSAIGNIALNPADQKEFIQQAIAAHRQSGSMFGQTTIKGGKTLIDKPIIPMKNGPANLESYSSMLAYYNNQVLDVTGIPAILAATPSKSQDMAVGIGELEVVNAGHALFPIKAMMLEIQKFAAELILDQVRLDIRFDPEQRKKWEGILGTAKMNAIWEVRDLTREELAINLKSVPTIKQKAEMKFTIQKAADSSSRNGIVTLTAADLMFINNLIDSDQTEIAQIYAAMVTEERMEQHRAQAEKSQQMNGQLQAEAGERVEAAKQKTIQMQIELETIQKEKLLMLDKQTPSAEIAQRMEGEKEQISMEIAGEAATGTNIKNPRS